MPGQHLCHVQHRPRPGLALDQPAEMQQTRGVGGDQYLGPGCSVIRKARPAHLCRHLRFPYGEGAAEAAALVRACEVDDFDPGEAFEKTADRVGATPPDALAGIAETEFAQAVTADVESYAVRRTSQRNSQSSKTRAVSKPSEPESRPSNPA